MSHTLTRADLTESVHAATGLARSECTALVEDLLDVITQALIRGESVKLSGIGTFSTRVKAERQGRNPATAIPMTISRRRVVTYKPSLVLRHLLNAALR